MTPTQSLQMDKQTSDRCFRLRCQSKRGMSMAQEDRDFLNDCFKKYPDHYSAMEAQVFDATKPYGA